MNLSARQKLGEVLERLKINKSRRALAKELGVSATAVIGWETGSSEPDRDNLMKIAELAGYRSLDEFLYFLEGVKLSEPSDLQTMLSLIDRINDPFKLKEIGHYVDDRLAVMASRRK